MPQLQALTCPVCAAPLGPNTETCGFCGSYIVIKTDLPRLDGSSLNQSVIHEHIGDFRRRVRSNSYDEEAHYGLGVAYFNLGLLDESVDELTHAAKLMPENPHIQAQLAIVLHESYKAGNRAAEPEVQARIQRALLLDPQNVEASLLKAEVLAEKNQLQEAVSLLRGLRAAQHSRVQVKLTTLLHRMGQKKLADQEWEDAQWCWQTLQPIDLGKAKDLAVRFLNLNRKVVPKTLYPGSEARPKANGGEILARLLMAFVSAIGGFFVGMVIFMIVAFNFVDNADGTSAGESWLMALTFLVLFGSPIAAAVWYWIASGRRRAAAVAKANGDSGKVDREELLRGEASEEQTLAAAESIMTNAILIRNVGRSKAARVRAGT